MIDEIFDGFEYISFDLYDTLIYRRLKKTTDVFDLVAQKAGINGFKKKRIKAEILARKECDREVTLNDIYKNINIDSNKIDALISIEESIEIEITVPNLEMIKILEECQRRNKKIIINTDIYLSKDIVEKILKKNNIIYDFLFVSSDTTFTKYSGKMYQHILKELNIMPDVILHIGDNHYADIIQARNNGIQAVNRKSFLYSGYVANDSLKDYINYNNIDLEKYSNNVSFKIGNEIIGPFLKAFCRYIKSVKEENKIDFLVFVSREGFLIKKVYDLMFPEDNDCSLYMSLNRNILRKPYIKVNPSIHALLKTIPKYDSFSFNVLLDLLGIDETEESINIFRKYFSNNIISYNDMFSPKFKDMFDELIEDNVNKFEEDYNTFMLYLKENKIYDRSFILINNSFNATGHEILNEILSENDNYYSIQFELTKKAKQKKLGNSISWFDNYKISKKNREIFYRESRVFEHLLFDNVGTTKSLKYEKDNLKVINDNIGFEYFNNLILNAVQNGVLNSISSHEIEEPLLTINKLIDFLGHPTLDQATVIGNIYDKDEYGTNLLIENYFFSKKELVKKMLKGNFNSKWSAGIFAVNSQLKKIKIFYDIRFLLSLMLKNRW